MKRSRYKKSSRRRGKRSGSPLKLMLGLMVLGGGGVLLAVLAGGNGAAAEVPAASVDGAAGDQPEDGGVSDLAGVSTTDGSGNSTAANTNAEPKQTRQMLREQQEALHKADQAYQQIPGTNDRAKLEELLFTARDNYAIVLDGPMAESQRATINKRLDDCNQHLIFSPMQHRLSELYVVKHGDTLGGIGQPDSGVRLQGIGLILAMNGMDSNMIRVGQTLKVLKGHVKVIADKSDFTVSIWCGGDTIGWQLIKQYRCGTGTGGITPEGVFEIRTKQREPAWRGVPYGDPNNPLGTHWLGFKDDTATVLDESQYALHGTWEPELIPSECSHGCLRLRNEDIEEAYGFLPRTTMVIIRP